MLGEAIPNSSPRQQFRQYELSKDLLNETKEEFQQS